mmetsp:Transcript_79957/g.252774  ORF Transcript_79957/g.252774 Transcript_79957/m.252774 type:complete len:114 (+) Transcript_79957:868-1209(+)
MGVPLTRSAGGPGRRRCSGAPPGQDALRDSPVRGAPIPWPARRPALAGALEAAGALAATAAAIHGTGTVAGGTGGSRSTGRPWATGSLFAARGPSPRPSLLRLLRLPNIARRG